MTLNIPSTWKTLFNGLSPWEKSGRQLVLAGPLHLYILAGWNSEFGMWQAQLWEGEHKHGECLTVDHDGMVRWCEDQTQAWRNGMRESPFASIAGKWPGDETEEEISEALERLS